MPLLPELDPLDEQSLIEALGGEGPLPSQPMPTQGILATLAKGVRNRSAREAMEKFQAQQAKEQAAQVKEAKRNQPQMSVTLKGPLGQVPDSSQPQPLSKVTLKGPLGNVPEQPQGEPGEPLETSTPLPLAKRVNPFSMMMSPFTATGAGIAGASNALLNQPPEAGATARMGAALQGGVKGAANALDPMSRTETPNLRTISKEQGADLGPVAGEFLNFAGDPGNYVGAGPFDDIAKAGIGAVSLIPKIIENLPEAKAATIAAFKALPEGPIATARAAGAAYEGYKSLKALDPAVAKAFMSATANYPRVRKAAQSLHPSEVARLTTEDAVRDFDRFYQVLPDPKNLLGGVYGGASKRGWYENSRKAIEAVYGEDADLFAGVLASTSPRIPVEENFKLANGIFDAWKKAGRPTDTATIQAVMQGSMNRKVLPAWVNNTVSTLQEGKTLSGAKVDSFWTNLRSRVRQTPYGEMNPDQAVTLDAWMANLFGVHKETFGGSPTELQLAEGNPGLSPQYLAGSARMREAATAAGLSPAEAQETIWSWGKALYEQAEKSKGKLSARDIIEQGLLDPKRIEGVPDFAQLFSQMGHKVPVELMSASKWKPDATAKKEMLVLADTLDALRAQRGRATEFKTAAPVPGTAMASFPLEAAPGKSSGVGTDFPRELTPKQLAKIQKEGKRTPEEALQGSQDTWSSARLSKFEDEAGRNILAEALYPGRTAPVAGGRGDYTNAEKVIERNKLQTTPVQMRMVEGKEGPQVHPEDTKRASFLSDALAYLLGQEASAMTTMHPVAEGGAPNIVRAWQRKTGEYYPQSALDELRKFLPSDQFALEQGTEGITIKKITGEPLTLQEQARIEQVSKDAVVNMKSRTEKQLAEPEKLAGSRAMTDVGDPAVAYREQPWGPEGGRGMTERLLTNWDSFPAAIRRNADKGVMRVAEDLLRVGGTGRADQINALNILKEGGFSALAKALGDPSQVLPVLAALGLGAAFGLTETGQRQEEKGGGT